ncbi:zinc finger protein 90-like isoform X2 [Passer montanus]|uniref:zinc finger protein 90-like isoform X2 n=1 Tax=Passer montanus TaxID=9160 RepID=UPI00195FBD82|nr:zinc finger protein 90-like isoform X2 [Passer montanus]
MAGQAQEPMTFEDVAVFLSRAEWDALTAWQRELYRDVVSDTYELLTSLGYPGPKPDILHRLERGEEPWICSSPGHAGSWLEEPSSGGWPRASGYQGLETSCPAGWSTLWCLQDRSFQKKFGCHEGRSEVPSEADVGVRSQGQPWLVKEEEEDKPGLMEDITHSETFLLHSVMEQQSLNPWEQLWDGPGERSHGNAQNHGHTLGEATLLPRTRQLRVEELRAAVAKDHGYCLRSEPGTPCAPRTCCLWEHNYCQQRRARGSREARGNHEAGRSHEASTARAMRRQLARRHLQWGRTFRRAREILRRYQPYWRLGFPWRDRSSSGSAAQGTSPAVCPPTNEAAPRQLQGAGNAEGETLDTRRAPEGILGTGGSSPALIPDVGVGKRAKPLEHPGARQELEGGAAPQESQEASLQDVFRNVLKTVRYILDSLCQKFELQGVSQGKSIWPIVIQIDNLTEIRKH